MCQCLSFNCILRISFDFLFLSFYDLPNGSKKHFASSLIPYGRRRLPCDETEMSCNVKTLKMAVKTF